MGEFDFDGAPWHDAELLAVTVDRRRPGDRDTVQLDVIWPDGGAVVVEFNDCFRFVGSMNFGVVAVETIRCAASSSSGQAVEAVRAQWGSIGVSVADLREYTVETNSTASTLIIVARSVQCSLVLNQAHADVRKSVKSPEKPGIQGPTTEPGYQQKDFSGEAQDTTKTRETEATNLGPARAGASPH